MFQRNLCGFIARKSDLLFRSLTEEEKNRNRSLEAIDGKFFSLFFFNFMFSLAL